MKKLIFVACLFAGSIGFSQSNFSLYQLNNSAQAQYLNPAFRSSAKIGVSIAPFSNLFNLQVLHTGFTLDDALATRPDSDSLDLTPAKLMESLNDVNYLDFNLRNEILAVTVTTKKTTINFTVNSVVNTGFSYPKDLLRLAFYGNGGPEFLGKRAAIDNLGFDAQAYIETGIGFNRKFGDKLTVGAKLKYLVGIGNIQTEYMRAGITTDANTYAIALDGAARVNTSNTEGLNAIVNNFTNPFAAVSNIAGIRNNGVGIDLGATYKLGKKVRLSASVIDLGAITWRESVTNYQIDEFKFEYDGVDLVKYLADSNAVFDEITDSLQNLSNIQETNNTYSTNLYSKIYLGGNFNVTKFFNLGLVWYNSFNPSRYVTGLNFSANVKLKHRLAVTANYSVYNYRDSNVGIGLSSRGGPVQFYIMSDNVFAILKPESTKNLHLSFGLSFQIGKSFEFDKPDGDMTIF
ncbi:MAG: DUF5723 family protein [Crocinitomicaceae bacterium]